MVETSVNNLTSRAEAGEHPPTLAPFNTGGSEEGVDDDNEEEGDEQEEDEEVDGLYELVINNSFHIVI